MVEEDNTWYVAITHMVDLDGKRVGGFSSFEGAGSSCYRDFKYVAKRNGVKIIAEQFDVDGRTINRLTGFDEQNRRTNRFPLAELVRRLNSGEQLNTQEELAKMCTT